MKKFVSFNKPFAFFLLFFACLTAVMAEEYKFVGSKRIDKDTRINASLLSLRGTIQIEGQLAGSVMQIGGKLIVSGHVTADVIALGTDIELLEHAVIDGDCLLVGGTLIKAETAQIKGEYFYVKLGSKEVESTFFPLIWGAGTVTLIKLVKVILWLLLGLMVYAMLPVRLHAMSLLLESTTVLIHGLTGLLTVTISFLLLIVFTLLSLVLIGIPLLLVLLILGSILLLVGRTVMMYSMGSLLAKKVRQSNAILSISLGALLYGVLKFIPLIGFVVLILVDVIGVGIVISYLLMIRKKV